MKVQFFQDTHTLAISLADRPAADAEEIAEGFIIERDAADVIVGIVIDDTRAISGFDPSVTVGITQRMLP